MEISKEKIDKIKNSIFVKVNKEKLLEDIKAKQDSKEVNK